MGKILALDYGKKRTGIALSDDMRIFAFGHSTADTKNLQSVLQNLVTQEKVSTIILGEPKRLNNEVSSITEMVYQFQKNLESWFPEIEIVLVDERYTSKMAQDSILQSGAKKKKRQDKALIDTVSATILLQTYLETI